MMNDVTRSHRPQRWILRVSAGIAVLLVGGFTFLAAVGMHERAHNPALRALTGIDSSTAVAPVTVTMGKVVLRIPRNYFLAMPSHDIQERPDGVEFILLGLMPDFEPRTDVNRTEFADFHGFGRKLEIFVMYRGYTRTGKELFGIFYNLKFHRSNASELHSDSWPMKSAEFGYQLFNMGGVDYMFRGTVDDPRDFIHCLPQNQIVPPGQKPIPYYPDCERIVLVGDNLVVKFSFSRDFLGKSHDIEASVIDVLNRFRTSSPAIGVIQ